MKIAVIGGGPGGLYFSILTKKARPDWDIAVFERNRPDDSFGFGVVFSDETLGEFLSRDPASYDLIRASFAYWDDIVVARDGEQVSISGNGFCGCSRKTLLQLLHQRCTEEGVSLNFTSEIADLSRFSDADLIVACDGIGSQIRTRFADAFGTAVTLKRNRFVWCGSTRPLDAFTYFFRNTEHGLMVAHSYQYEQGMSTWIFECSEETWQRFGFEIHNETDTLSRLEALFAAELAGHRLIGNKSHWRQFPHVTNRHWFYQNIVLLGDAKATAHFSIGSGTKLAMECAIALSDAVLAHPTDIQQAFGQYEQTRRGKVEAIQQAANVSLEWFENMNRYRYVPFFRFAFGCMTRSRKVGYENLHIRDSSFTDQVRAEFLTLQSEGGPQPEHPTSSPAFTPFFLRETTLVNRIVQSAMGQYRAEEGTINDWHFQHYASRALGGVGLLITEMTAVSALGRITPGCAGIYTEAQEKAWKRVVDFVHQNSAANMGIQLGHAGRKGSVKRPWDTKLEAEPWPLYAASPLPFSPDGPVPREMGPADMDEITDQFVQATLRADRAGFDLIELQAHHGFLLASFLSPLTNRRTDEFGGPVQNRLAFPLRVFREMRKVFPAHKPMAVRISAHDGVEGGISQSDALEVARAFHEAGADLLHVSSGQTVPETPGKKARMWQVPYSDAIRNILGIPTVTAGGIDDIDQINTILLNGNADLVALGRPLLLDPGFVRRAQAYEGVVASDIPPPYSRALEPLVTRMQWDRKQTESMKKALKPRSNKP